MLAISDLSVQYGRHEALLSISLQVARDEIVVILGANGAGKSTLLSAIAGNCPGEVNGYINLKGEQLLGLETAQIVERGVAYVPEGRGVFADLSVEENLQLGSYSENARHNERENLNRVLGLFPKLNERKKQIVRTMSGGEQQMVAIGRALMSAPAILMLDEPSLGLSPLLCKELFSSLLQVRDSGVGILLVEQNAKQSLSIADRGYLLGNGKIIGQDNAQNLLNDASVQAAYLGGAASTTISTKTSVRHAEPKPGTADSAGSSSENIPVFTPANINQTSVTQSSSALLHDDIDAIVARASSTATVRRENDTNLPQQVIKLSTAAPAVQVTTSKSSAGLSSKPVVTPVGVSDALNLPLTADSKVQALLAEFEQAAKIAASGSSNGSGSGTLNGSTNASTHASTDREQTQSFKSQNSASSDDDPFSLPTIPVYKKNSVTVYRRDGSGTLRKQEKT